MKPTPSFTRRLRVLLAGSTPGCSAALVSWLGEGDGLDVVACDGGTVESLAVASMIQHDVILLDFHGMAESTERTVALFKEISPPPAVFLLTHDGSSAMRRHCLRAQVDAVFDKTAELDALRSALEHLAREAALPASYRRPSSQSSDAQPLAHSRHVP